MSFLEAVDCKKWSIKGSSCSVAQMNYTEKPKACWKLRQGVFPQRRRNAQGGTAADGRGNSSAAWNGALKLRKQTFSFNTDIF